MVWTYFPNGYIVSSLCEERGHDYEVCILIYYEYPATSLVEKLKKLFRIQTRFIGSEYLEEGDIPLPEELKNEKPDGGMLCFRHISGKKLKILTEYIKNLPTPEELTVEITGCSYRFWDDSKVKWKVKRNE